MAAGRLESQRRPLHAPSVINSMPFGAAVGGRRGRRAPGPTSPQSGQGLARFWYDPGCLTLSNQASTRLQPAAKQSRMLGSMDAMLAIGLPMPVMIKLTHASISGHGRAGPALGSSARQQQPKYAASPTGGSQRYMCHTHPPNCPNQQENVLTIQ